jgi:hypothetical protein
MQVRLFGEREESPGKFPNGTANRPAQLVLHSAEVEVVLSACFEQIKQLVFGVDKLLGAGEIVPPATLVPLAEILRVEDDQGFCMRAQRAVLLRMTRYYILHPLVSLHRILRLVNAFPYLLPVITSFID